MAKKNRGLDIDEMLFGLDLMVAGRRAVIGSDFLMTMIDPFNAEIGHLDPKDLRTFDQDFVDMLLNIKPKQKICIPRNLKSICQDYIKQRERLSTYHEDSTDLLFTYDVRAAKELGNFDKYINKVVTRNDAELTVLYDYIALYRKINGKRSIVHWGSKKSKLINEDNETVINAHAKAKFAVLRLDQNLDHGAIRVINVINEEECILIDRALHSSQKEGFFFVCSLLDMKDYYMTSGGGIPVPPMMDIGRSAITLLKKHLNKLRSAKSVINNDIIKCVREVYGFCLRSGIMEHMTIHR
jgi:hypothetical protein